MRVVWVGSTGSEIQVCNPESVVDMMNKSTTLLFWANYKGVPLLVIGAPGAHACTYEYLSGNEFYKDLDPGALIGAATIRDGEISGWYSSCFKSRMPMELRPMVTEVLAGKVMQH